MGVQENGEGIIRGLWDQVKGRMLMGRTERDGRDGKRAREVRKDGRSGSGLGGGITGMGEDEGRIR